MSCLLAFISKSILDCHRTNSRGGGTALLYQENIPVEKVSAAILNKFFRILRVENFPLLDQ